MIRYRLKCDKDHGFEAWFKSSKAYDFQAKRSLVACPVCGSTKTAKDIMAPSVATSRKRRSPEPAAGGHAPAAPAPEAGPTHLVNGEQRKLIAMMRALREEIIAKSDYVGPRFAEEARKIHNEETPARGIYGEATPEEVKELREDGVDVLPIPVLPDDQN